MFTRRLITSLFAALVAATAVATLSAAGDMKPPRIVAAAMQDSDGDFRADRLRLTYSERVRHAADRDGRYPFVVAGYRVTSAAAASGRVVVLALAEKAAADDAARPAIRYRRTASKPVGDVAKNQALGQLFRATRAHGNRPPATPPPPSADADRDDDGVEDARDCAPTDPAIKPGAPDTPDLAFFDSNCDGIDGNEQNAIFVSNGGKDTNPGTRAAPKREIQAAVVAAALAGKDVYAGSGEYNHVETAGGVDIYGGYVATGWTRRLDARTRIVGAPEAVLASGDNVVLQLLTVVGLGEQSSGSSAYGIRAIAGSRLTLQRVDVIANRGADGVRGPDGTNGLRGGNGGRGETGSCDTEVGGLGGRPGESPAGSPGGWGGRGGLERLDRDGRNGSSGKAGAQIGGLGGDGGANGNPGKSGLRGHDGAPGKSGAQGSGGTFSAAAAAQRTWRGSDGGDGTTGTPGAGGGGGGGGGGQKGRFVIDGVGNGGGGGGGGGGAGTGGKGGRAGGGSFGVYLHDSTAILSAGSSIKAGDGGAGGAGGRGGLAGIGGEGADGRTWCTGEVGASGAGGDGGPGGFGGGGGGGAGGPSIGVMTAGSSTATITDTRIDVGTPGPAGAPGAGGGGGAPAHPGVARTVLP